MSRSDAASSGSDTSVAAYEELRSRVLAHSGAGSHSGLALLLRGGIAAWLSAGSAGSIADALPAQPGRPARSAAALVQDAIGAHVVRVLASMALGGLDKEIRT